MKSYINTCGAKIQVNLICGILDFSSIYKISSNCRFRPARLTRLEAGLSKVK